jgi:membrane protease subunit (stomatin/prohibitin family)
VGLLAARAATRMGARQQYRTMARMQRRRTWAQDRMGMRQDFQTAGDDQYADAPAEPAAPDYTAELERLAQLRDQGVITTEDFDAKKRQLLGL